MISQPYELRRITAEAVALDARQMAVLERLQAASEEAARIASALAELVPADLEAAARALEARVAAFSPRIALVGQVKAGKSALANALVGVPDLLPSDVNPWTSVVTSVRLNQPPSDGNHAVFRFFDKEPWDAVVEHGGRLGRLAGRADAEEEAEALRAQVAGLRARAVERLGRNYHLLLGQTHAFSTVTPDLIRRYVCLGDEADDAARREGRFADLMRSADLHIAAPEFSIPLTIQDTPGVNDPFLLREQMTIDVLGGAETCILVLSAYQALTTVDLGLVRLIRTLRPEQVVVFVNRVDELSDPKAELPAIRASIRAMLVEGGGGGEPTVLFGSARWAGLAATGALDDLVPSDAAYLERLGVARGDPLAVRDALRRLSGLPGLKAALAERIAAGPGAALLDAVSRTARDLLEQTRLHAREVALPEGAPDEFAVANRLDALVSGAERSMDEARREAAGGVDAIRDAIVTPWIERMARRIENGADEADTAELCPAMVAAYDQVVSDARAAVTAIVLRTERELRAVYTALLAEGADAIPMHPCRAPDLPRPASLARSTSFDLRGAWTERLRRAGVQAERRVARFRAQADREFADMLSDVADRSVRVGFERAFAQLHLFVASHVVTIQRLAAGGPGDGTRGAVLADRRARLLSELDALEARLDALAAGEAAASDDALGDAR